MLAPKFCLSGAYADAVHNLLILCLPAYAMLPADTVLSHSCHAYLPMLCLPAYAMLAYSCYACAGVWDAVRGTSNGGGLPGQHCVSKQARESNHNSCSHA